MERKKILVVDDNSSICELVKSYLEQAGDYEVATETDSTQALAAIHGFEPDMVFLDIVMPKIDGPEISRRLVWEDKSKNIPIVFLTGIITEAELKALQGVVDGRPCVAKPVTFEKLRRCVRQHIN